mgnify:CR=1 FL=1
MPRRKGRITSIPGRNSTGEDTTNAATSSSSTTSRELPSDMTFTFNISSIDEKHRINTNTRRTSQKKGRAEKFTQGYLRDKMDYIRFCKMTGEGGQSYMRGVLVPEEKRPWDYAYVTIDRVLWYLDTILVPGYQYKVGGKRKEARVRYEPTNVTWYEDHLKVCPEISDDRDRVNTSKAIRWKGTADSVLKAIQDLKKEQMATNYGKNIYQRMGEEGPLRGKDAQHSRFRAIQELMDTRNEKQRENNNEDKFKTTLVNGYGMKTHEDIITYYLRQGGYNGALFAMVQAHCFQEAHRGENILAKEMSDMGLYPLVDATALGLEGRMAIKCTIHQYNPDISKNETVCSVRSKNATVCILSLTGIYFFYRYVVHGCPEPEDLVPRDFIVPSTDGSTPSLSSSSSSNSNTTSSSSSSSSSGNVTASSSSSTSSNTSSNREKWRSERLLAQLDRNNVIDPTKTIPKSSLSSAIKRGHTASGAKQWVTGTLHAARHSASVTMEANQISERMVKKQLQHKETDTTRIHYTNVPPIQSIMALAGFHPNGSDFDPLHALARSELESDYIDLVNAIIPHSNRAEAYCRTIPGDFNRSCHVNLLRECSKCAIESAAMMRIESKNQDFEFYKYAPFNTPRFDAFCAVLKEVINSKRPERGSMSRSLAFLEKGKLKEAMQESTRAMGIQINNVVQNENRLMEERLFERLRALIAPIGSHVVAGTRVGPPEPPNTNHLMVTSSSSSSSSSSANISSGSTNSPSSSFDITDTTTWPLSSDWTRNIRLNPALTSLQDIFGEWNHGWNGNPSLRLLEQRYPRGKWRQGQSSLSAAVVMRKYIMKSLPSQTSVPELQNQLYAHFEADTEAKKSKLRNWPSIKKFLNQNLRKRNAGWQERSEDRKRRRLKKNEDDVA